MKFLLTGILFALTAAAQDPVIGARSEVAPAIVLLLSQPRPLDVAKATAGYAKVVKDTVGDAASPKGAWLRAAGDEIIGGRDGGTWRIRSVAAKAELPAAAIAALGELDQIEETERERVLSHRAHLVVTAPPGEPVAVYRRLGEIAAALLAEDVVAVRAAHHDTVIVADDELAGRLGDVDPLGALAPDASTSLVVFLRAAREFDEAAMSKAIGKELDVKMVKDGAATENFVVAKGSHAVVRLRGETAFVDVGPRVKDFRSPGDADAQQAIAAHRAMLRVGITGRATGHAETARRRLVARIVAALWADDCLAINWHCDQRTIAAEPMLVLRLRSEDPVGVSLGDAQLPIVVPGDADAMEKAIAEARATWNTAATHFRGGGKLNAKFAFVAKGGGHEHIWIWVTKIDGDRVHGALANDPQRLEGRKLGDTVECRLGDLSDWVFERDGKMVGGYTVKVLEAQMRARSNGK